MTSFLSNVAFSVRKEENGYVEAYRLPSSQSALQELRKRNLDVDAELDLHGMTSVQAKAAVARFLTYAYERGARVIGIVHGKGLHSEDGKGVLAQHVVSAITQEKEGRFVLAFRSAPPSLGGTGALLLRLQKNRLANATEQR